MVIQDVYDLVINIIDEAYRIQSEWVEARGLLNRSLDDFICI